HLKAGEDVALREASQFQREINVLKGYFNKQEENLRRNLNNDMRNILGSFFQNQPSTAGTLLSNIVPNPKGEMKVITTRSGLAYEGPSIPTESPLEKVDEQNTEEILDKEHSNSSGSTTQVQPSVVPILIPKPDVPRTQTKPTIHYLSRMEVCHGLADLGASINLMPLSIWKKLSLPELTPTQMTLEVADRSITHPKGVAEDVFFKVGKFHFPTNFVVVDFEANPRVPLILRMSLLRISSALIDVYGEEITLRVNDESITFNLNQTMRYSSTYDDTSVNRVDVIDIACEEFVQDVLDFQYNSKSSSPTLDILGLMRAMYTTIVMEEDASFLRYGHLSTDNAAVVRKEPLSLSTGLRPMRILQFEDDAYHVACGHALCGIFIETVVLCAGIIGIKHRHKDVPGKEVDIGLSGGRDPPCPADMLFNLWDIGFDACVGLIGSSPLTQTEMVEFVPARGIREECGGVTKANLKVLCCLRHYGASCDEDKRIATKLNRLYEEILIVCENKRNIADELGVLGELSKRLLNLALEKELFIRKLVGNVPYYSVKAKDVVCGFIRRDENIKAIERSLRYEKLDKAVSGRRWMDMMIVYLQDFDDEQRDFFSSTLPICDELRRAVSTANWEPQFILYCQRAMGEDQRLAWQINVLCDTLTDVIERREKFVAELDMLVSKFVPRKMVEFMKETLNKDVPNLMKL
nr:reverse transcriptase domain-containing protein [Tanacetum cinerariifolium]